jgi:hypothetical protein
MSSDGARFDEAGPLVERVESQPDKCGSPIRKRKSVASAEPA